MSQPWQMAKQILIVAKYSYLEIIKSKVLVQVVLLGIGLMAIIFVAKEFTYGVPERVALDVGLGLLSLSSVGIALFMGAGLISAEIENRTVYMILSRPISRFSFLFGKIMGMAAVLVINIAVLGLLTTSFCVALGGDIDQIVIGVLVFSMLEAILVLFLVILFSLVGNKIMAIIYTLALYIIGHSLVETKSFIKPETRPILIKIINFFEVVLPNFAKLNLKDYVIYKQTLPWEFLIGAFSYGLAYILFLLLLSSLAFEVKNLD